MKCTGMTAKQFNKHVPVGTPVRYYPIIGGAEFIETRTRSEAWNLGHGEPVVKVTGTTGGVVLEAIETIEGAETEDGSKKDLVFLTEMRERLENARNGDQAEFDYLAQMMDDWIAELELKAEDK